MPGVRFPAKSHEEACQRAVIGDAAFEAMKARHDALIQRAMLVDEARRMIGSERFDAVVELVEARVRRAIAAEAPPARAEGAPRVRRAPLSGLIGRVRRAMAWRRSRA